MHFKEALLQLQVEPSSNSKTNNVLYGHSFSKTNSYLIKLPSHLARLVLKPKPGCWISGLIIKETIKVVCIIHFVLSVMRHLFTYSNVIHDSGHPDSFRISHYNLFSFVLSGIFVLPQCKILTLSANSYLEAVSHYTRYRIKLIRGRRRVRLDLGCRDTSG